MPRENQPTLVVTAGLPDGRGLQTPPRRGALHLRSTARSSIASNASTTAGLSLRVVHDEDAAGRSTSAS